MYKVYDMYGYLVRGNFNSYIDALMWKETFGRPDWTIGK